MLKYMVFMNKAGENNGRRNFFSGLRIQRMYHKERSER